MYVRRADGFLGLGRVAPLRSFVQQCTHSRTEGKQTGMSTARAAEKITITMKMAEKAAVKATVTAPLFVWVLVRGRTGGWQKKPNKPVLRPAMCSDCCACGSIFLAGFTLRASHLIHAWYRNYDSDDAWRLILANLIGRNDHHACRYPTNRSSNTNQIS